jgi:hypothetical protein
MASHHSCTMTFMSVKRSSRSSSFRAHEVPAEELLRSITLHCSIAYASHVKDKERYRSGLIRCFGRRNTTRGR